MITVSNISKTYGRRNNRFVALDDVSFNIPNGKTAAIIGKSGSGKSTLMHILGGLDQPTSGTIMVDDEDITKLKRRKMDRFRSHKLGFVFQSFFIEGNQTCYQNVGLPLEISRLRRRKRKALIEAALEQVDLADKKRTKAKNLSGGQKQRLAIARAIVSKPRLLLADEPTGNLDSATGEKIISLLFDLHKDLGTALVIVTHDADLAARCDIQIQLKDGKLL